jgi:hypothetical protein
MFDIPAFNYQSTAGARRGYFRCFGREWPHSDDDLRELARQVPPAEAGFSRCNFLIDLMRERHTFEEDGQ